MRRVLPNISWAIFYLGATGAITEEDLYLYLIVQPRLEIIFNNYDYFIRKYREKLIVKYIKDLLFKYRRGDIFSQLKLLSSIMSQVPESKIRLYIPYLAEVIANIERRAIELGIYDTRLEKIFERLYDALYKDRPRVNEILTALSRVIIHVERAEKAMRKEIESTPAKVFVRTGRKPKVSQDLLKDFVSLVYEYNKQGKELLVVDALNEFFSKHQDELGSMADAYIVYKEAIANKYIEERNKRLYITKEGKRFIGEK